MSHFSTLRTKITDAEILKASLRDLGISVKTEADVRGYNGQRFVVTTVNEFALTSLLFSMANMISVGLAIPTAVSI